MTDTTSPTLHLICGKIAAGKSTLAAKLGALPGTVTLSEDTWLAALYADQMTTGADYLRFSAKLHRALGPHVVAVLKAGVSVVLDFPANTPDQRRWMRQVIDEAGANHLLHLLDVADEVCLSRLKVRNAEGGHDFAATEAQFWQFSKHFQPPTDAEGFQIIRH